MEIIKAFQTNDIGMNITIKGNYDDPLFRASDIGLILGFNDINNTVKHFGDREKVRLSMPTPGGIQEVNFLTEIGLYKLLFKSKKEIAQEFQNWVCDVLKEIRIKGKYELEEKLKIKDQQILTIKEKTMINDFDGKRVLYLCKAEENVIKFGFSDDLITRITTHKREIGNQLSLQYIIETTYNRELEQLIKQKLKDKIITKVYEGRKEAQTELIQLDNTFTLSKLYKQILEYLETFNDKDALLKAYEEIDRLKKELDQNTQTVQKPEKPKVNQEITELKKKVAHLKGEKQFIARNIITGEIKSFNSYDAARDITKIGCHSLRDNYLNQPRQCRGWVFHDHDKPCWYPPENFIFNVDTKPSSHMLMCKSVDKETGSETYFNSIVECSEHISKLDVDFENTETNRRTINRLVQTNKPTVHKYLSKFNWYIVESCGKVV
jgi:prophage antirepressor-like protein